MDSISNVRMRIGMVYFYIMVGLIIIFIDMKNMEVNRFFIGCMICMIFFVLMVFVSRDFMIKVFNVVENFVFVVIIIIFR